MLARASIIVAIVFGLQSFAWAAPSLQDQKETGSISGRVTLDGKPIPGLIVVATPGVTDPAKMVERMLSPHAAPRATTDSEGHYRLDGVSGGTYNVSPAAPELVSFDGDEQKEVTISGSAAVDNIDFALSRGGVITGRVTDSDGHPVIGDEISIESVDPAKLSHKYAAVSDRRMYSTDDRGVYRIYGIRPGRYRVSAGVSDAISGLLAQGPKRIQTYYPGVSDQTGARPVEVSAGAEASNVDIKLLAPDKGFTVNGRVFDAETGRPIPNAMVSYSGKPGDDSDDHNNVLSIPTGITITDAKGEFRLASIAPGNYRAEVESLGQLTGASEYYADPVNFEVHSGNVDKLEIKVHSGASISGVVVIENTDGADALEQLSTLVLAASVSNVQTKLDSTGIGRVAADGSFRIGGLKSGNAKIGPVPYGPRKYSLLRIELNGVAQPDGIDIQSNEQVAGVRIILVTANGVIRGHVTIQGDLAPQSLYVTATPMSGEGPNANRTAIADAKGGFVIDGVAPGDYTVRVSAALPGTSRSRVAAEQTVTVESGIPAEVTLVLNLTRPDK